jgi:hypothetical protein
MRLLNITNRYYILIALDLLLIGNAFLAYRLLSLVDADITKNLLREKQEIDNQLLEQKQIRNLHFRIGDGIEIEPIDKFTTFKVDMHDTDIMDLNQKKDVVYRMLTYEQWLSYLYSKKTSVKKKHYRWYFNDCYLDGACRCCFLFSPQPLVCKTNMEAIL